MENCNMNNSGIVAYNEQNQELIDKFLEDYFYSSFRDTYAPVEGRRSLELIISPKCNLGCKYCYIHRYKKDIFCEDIFDEELTITNLKKILNWLHINKFNPPFEIFSGELFAQEIGFKVLDIIYEDQKQCAPNERIPAILIPTNFTFICSDELTERVEDILEKFDSIGIRCKLSASFDGKYMEQNRPAIRTLDLDIDVVRDDEYYNKVFAFCIKHHIGLHPMLYSQDIELWEKNFIWFQEKMKEFNIPWEYIYLLEVRNEEWNAEQIKTFEKFVEFLYDFAWKKCGEDKNELLTFLFEEQGFNLLAEPIFHTGRGLTCSIQDTLHIRVADLMVYPCHRLGYKQFYYGQYVDDGIQGLRFINQNAELQLMINTVHKESLPICAECAINQCCSGQCLGASYEAIKNMFVPIPTVCILKHSLVKMTIKCLKKYGIYNNILKCLPKSQIQQFLYVEKEI